MSKLLQVRVDDKMKADVEGILSGLGLDVSTAVRMFFVGIINNDGLPFEVKYPKRKPNAELLQAIRDVENGENLYGPYDTVEEAMAAMRE